MIAAALLLAALADTGYGCAHVPPSRDASSRGVRHAFQNGDRQPLRLFWIDRQGKRVDFGTIAPGGYRALRTFAGHSFVVTDPAGRCLKAVRIGDGLAGTYVGTSRYRALAVRPGWRVFVDRALEPGAEPARGALAAIGRMLEQAEAVLPAASLAEVRTTPIFLLDHSGPGGMFHRDPDWLLAHGRTVEMLEGIEISDAAVFVETAKFQPGSLLHELAHALAMRSSDEDRAKIEASYAHAMARGLYRRVERTDGTVVDAYARTDPGEYFAELSEAYFGRNDFFPFTRTDLATYDPEGRQLIAEVWR